MPGGTIELVGSIGLEPGRGLSGLRFSFRIGMCVQEEMMSLASEREPWVDRWWPLLVICFGLVFVSVLVTFKPGT